MRLHLKFFAFYVTPRVDLYPISPCRNHGRPIKNTLLVAYSFRFA